MLSFLRNNSVKIVYGIIISFVVTTFLGVIFFNDSFKSSRDTQQKQMNRQSAIAVIGDLSVTEQVYQLELQRMGASLPKDLKVDENILEIIQLNALNRAIENTLLLEIGLAQNVKVKRAEINTALFSVMDQFKVTSKKELKDAILNAGGSYDAMLK
ncbi:MAG: SurA N-terminal domain-containing protein, partial [Candidatus Margulisiibacteriota bacterium]